ncbi:hypothetical protein [Muriicola soli]|uniref:Lipocalin-like domain-containing protein n=1 Tax=Muriicola soli TaxID=2507538 RepID=A0A411E6V2_9FLAO|nr:hypothetical protein [Muriicola soli]QBA63254.1 hypothetical protein EQY75_01020 [Muriicola soli]
MKNLRILLLVPFLMAFQCDEELIVIDELDKTGIYGRWEFADEEIDNISDLLPKCCRFYEFLPDDIPEDQSGLWSYTDGFRIYEGVFTVDEVNQTLLFERENRASLTYGYSLYDTNDYLELSFVEDGLNYVQGYIRKD